MRCISIKLTFGLFASLLTTACNNELEGNLENKMRAITFQSPQAETRAVVEDAQKMTAFHVWGWYGKEGNYGNNVFNNVEVSYSDGNWTYQDTQYWSSGYTYNFYAVYPAILPEGAHMNVDTNGKVTVEGFNCSATGEQAVDLMMASQTGITYENGEIPQPVKMNFSHELARVNFKIQTEEGTAYVTKASLTGVGYKGSLERTGTSISWTSLGQASEGIFERTSEDIEVNLKGTTLLDEMLLPPQNIVDSQVSLSVSYHYFALNEEHTKTATLPAITWEAGKSYTYTLTIESDGRIHFETPVIDKWDEALGGIIIVD